MDDGVKEDLTQCNKPKFLGMAGWMKKAPGRLFASYKDRYIHVEKTEIVVYENEDLQNCLERVDLENYDRCHELKSPLKKKHRLILIRSAKSANKVSDVKFQAQTAEEKEAWIKALTDGISRAKNKVFDEVKVDESSNLDHVTRTRAKGNPNRRPPTRIHMKEGPVVSCDAILHLDDDLKNGMMPHETINVSEMLEDAIGTQGPTYEVGTGAEPEVSSQKKVIKPPMPPNKGAKPSSVLGEPHNNDDSEKKVLKPPMPPSKETTPFISPADDITKEAKVDKSPEAEKKMNAPPVPPTKPGSMCSLPEPTQFRSSVNAHPGTPTLKDKKPSHPDKQLDLEVAPVEDEHKEKDDDHRKEKPGTAIQVDKADHLIHNEAQVSIGSTGEHDLEETRGTKTSPVPPQPSNQMPEKCPQPDKHVDNSPARRELHDIYKKSDSESSLQTEESLSGSEVQSVVSLNARARKRNSGNDSVDNGHNSEQGDDSEGSGVEDTLLDANEDNIQMSLRLRETQAANNSCVTSQLFPFPHTKPTSPLTCSTKGKSASIGDLLSDSSVFIQGRPNISDVAQCGTSPLDDVMKLEIEVALEMEKTDKLLSRVSKVQDEGDQRPKDLLSEAMEKLKKADHVLREVKKLELVNSPINRKSW